MSEIIATPPTEKRATVKAGRKAAHVEGKATRQAARLHKAVKIERAARKRVAGGAG